MNLDWYGTFFQLSKSGSFSQAAKDMYVTQPAISRSISQLEKTLGCTLFYRTRKGVTLTQQGVILYDNLKNAFDSISAAEKAIGEMRELKRGEIKIGTSDTLCKYYLVDHLRSFNNEYPSIKIRVYSQNTSRIIDLIKSGNIDFGIVSMPVAEKNLEVKSIMKVQDCFVAGEKYRELSEKKMHIEELIKYPLILLNEGTNTRKYINNFFKQNSLSIIPEFEFGNSDLLIEFAKKNFGIACLIKDFVVNEIKNKTLFELQIYEKIALREINVAWLNSVPLSVASNAFIKKLEHMALEK